MIAPMTDEQEYWPNGSRRSTNNGFTHGYLGIPHGYVIGGEVKPTPPRQQHVKAGFGNNNGTIPGMGNPRALTINKRRLAA